MPQPGTGSFPAAVVLPEGLSTFAPPMILVTERPPLQVHVEIETPAGNRYRWAQDAPDAANITNDLRHSSTMPGGFESVDVTLRRDSGTDYSDLEAFSTLRVRNASGGIVGEFRLERSPRTSGDDFSITPGGVGWQAALDDNKFAAAVYVDRAGSHWTGPSSARLVYLQTSGFNTNGGYDAQTNPALRWAGDANNSIPINSTAELWYVAPGGLTIEAVGYRGTEANTTNVATAALHRDDNETGSSMVAETLTLDDTNRVIALGAAERYLMLSAAATATHTPAANAGFTRMFNAVAVYGNHGVPRRANGTDLDGVFASDVVIHAVQSWAPALTVKEGETVLRSGFPIPHLVFTERTTAAAIIKEASRFGLEDWAVWEAQTFWWHPRGAYGRNWRARVAPSHLQETGPQAERIVNSVIVEYQDVSGVTKTVGPVGSGADTESAALTDSDPENPATQRGLTRREKLSMGVGTAASATEVGRRYLEEQKLLDTSGKATIYGYVEDDRGIAWPYHAVRAGDTITFVDASDPSPRRIVRAEHNDAERSCSVDLDSPPEGLAALLQRLGVVVVPLGF